MRDAVLAGAILNIFNSHAERVRMANLAQCVNVLQAVILTEKAKMILTPTYHVMEMYKVHQDAQLIPLIFDPTMYAFNGEAFPALSVSASKDANGITHISLVNIDSKRESKIVIDINHLNVKNIYGSILTSQKL